MKTTQVGIVGAGPAGLMLSHLLHLAGIESVVLEQRSRAYVEARIRAGVLEQTTVDLLNRFGVGERMRREGLVHHGVNLQFEGHRHRIALSELTAGKAITIYGQQEVVKDLIAARLAAGGQVCFDIAEVSIDRVQTEQPVIRYRPERSDPVTGWDELHCDVVAGCDGFHGVSRNALPAGVLRTFEREYPFGWLGILATVAPSTDELIYSYHDRGFSLHSLRSPELTRLYLQVDLADDVGKWPDERIWKELQIRLGSPGWSLAEGPIIEKSITAMRSFVVEPMQQGRLFLAGDAAHIVPPTGAKGMNLAIADVKVLADALAAWYRSADRSKLDAYSEVCLSRVWRVQDFSTTMTDLMHRRADDEFGRKLQRARQAYVCSSSAMARTIAENYVGLPLP
jgi:p-hydroxybenzoate 3-monooxygenase